MPYSQRELLRPPICHAGEIVEWTETRLRIEHGACHARKAVVFGDQAVACGLGKASEIKA